MDDILFLILSEVITRIEQIYDLSLVCSQFNSIIIKRIKPKMCQELPPYLLRRLNAKNITNVPYITTINRWFSNITEEMLLMLPNLTKLSLNCCDVKCFNLLTILRDLSICGTSNIINISNLRNLTSLNLAWYTVGNTHDQAINGLSTLTSLRKLNISNNNLITDNIFSHFTNITSLNLASNDTITNISGTVSPYKLRKLGLSCNKNIRDISLYTNLTSLDLSQNKYITSLGSLTNLTKLNLTNNKVIKNISHLTNIHILDLYANYVISINEICDMDIYELNLSHNDMIRYIPFTNLTSLDLSYNSVIRNTHIVNLSLNKLILESNTRITLNGIKHMTNLTYLSLDMNEVITDIPFTKLRTLLLGDNNIITTEMVNKLSNLTHLYLYDTQVNYDDLNLRIQRII